MALELEASADIELDVGKKKEPARHHYPHVRFDKLIISLNNVPASGALAQDLDGPALGRRWEVRRICADALNMGGLKGCTIFLLAVPAGYNPIPGFVASMEEWAGTSQAQLVESWGSEQFVIEHPEHLTISCYNPNTSPMTISGRIQIVDLPLIDLRVPVFATSQDEQRHEPQ